MTHTPGPMTTRLGCRCTDLIGANREEVGYVKDANHAAFIVRACNAHEAMLEALKRTKEVINNILTESQLDQRTTCGLTLRTYQATVEEAIRLAEGKG